LAKKTKWQEFKELFKPDRSISWRWRNFVNLIDDPVDNFKHWLNGLTVFGYKIRLPDWLMRGRDRPDK
jgi:hypothetical protein